MARARAAVLTLATGAGRVGICSRADSAFVRRPSLHFSEGSAGRLAGGEPTRAADRAADRASDRARRDCAERPPHARQPGRHGAEGGRDAGRAGKAGNHRSSSCSCSCSCSRWSAAWTKPPTSTPTSSPASSRACRGAASPRCWCPERHRWTGPSAPASDSTATPSTAAPRCTAAWISGRDRHAHHGLCRRHRGAERMAPGLRPGPGNRPKLRLGHALCPLFAHRGRAGCARQAQPTGGQSGQLGPFDGIAPAL